MCDVVMSIVTVGLVCDGRGGREEKRLQSAASRGIKPLSQHPVEGKAAPNDWMLL